jgi:LacI family transcriptional regulator
VGEATLRDVARLAEVHPGTVSRALDPDRAELVNEATRERVVAAAVQLGYRGNAVARSLRTGRSGIIGVVAADLGNPYLPPILRGIETVAGESGFTVLIAETHDAPGRLKEITDHLVTRRVDAVILAAVHLDDAALVADIDRSLPVVLAVRGLADEDHFAVLHDDVLGARLATEHLVALGHRRLAQLRGPRTVLSFVVRRESYESVVAATGVTDLTPDAEAVAPTIEEGRRLALLALDRSPEERPTALFAHNDMMAVGALSALAERGLRCPEDISLVGYNDSPLTDHLAPPLTTVRLQSGELGRRAAALALSRISGEAGPAVTVRLHPELILRASTRAL